MVKLDGKMSHDANEHKFGEYLNNLINHVFIGNAVGLGSQLGLFALMSEHGKPITSEELAKAGNFKERYIREWLALMATGKIVTYEKNTNTYFILEHKLPYLSYQGNSKCHATMVLEAMPMITKVTEELKECFKEEGATGISYDRYKGFHEWKSKEAKIVYDFAEMKRLLDLIPGMIKHLESGITVCEGGCAEGFQIEALASHFPKSTFIGFDIDKTSITKAQHRAEAIKLPNLQYVVQDGCEMPKEWTDKFDLFIEFAVVHDVPYSQKFIKEIYRCLKLDGRFYMAEIAASTGVEGNLSIPFSPRMYGFSLYHCMPVSLYFEGGEGLGLCWGTKMQIEYLDIAGFKDIKLLNSGDPFMNHFISRKTENKN